MQKVQRDMLDEAIEQLLDVDTKPWMKKWAVVDRLRIARSRINLILRRYSQEEK